MALTTLFIDFNSYFASVEQQVQPALRGRPIAVTPVLAATGCCIAASYEAKKFKVKTGTRVGEAKAMCPDILFVKARPRLYVIMHNRLLKAIDTCIPVHAVHSIDEMSCRLSRNERAPEAAHDLAIRIKKAIREHCGACMRCSIGIAPSRVLAKLGTDMHKPDGLVILTAETLRDTIGHLGVQELSGIGPQTTKALDRAGVRTISELMDKDEHEMERLWGGIIGRRWWHWLQGHEVTEPPTHKSSIGHQHVLAPDVRHNEAARAVAFRLMLKAAARMRHDNYGAKKLTLGVNFQGQPNALTTWSSGTHWTRTVPLGPCCTDTHTMLDAIGRMWADLPPGTPILVSVTLHDLVAPTSQTLPLFREEAKKADLSKAMDKVNAKFGANTVYPANIHNTRRHGAGGIAFNYVPNLEVTDSVGGSMSVCDAKMGDAEMEAMIEASLRAS